MQSPSLTSKLLSIQATNTVSQICLEQPEKLIIIILISTLVEYLKHSWSPMSKKESLHPGMQYVHYNSFHT